MVGGYDSVVQFWDFAGMNKQFLPFRSVEPFEKYVITIASPAQSLQSSNPLLLLILANFFPELRCHAVSSFQCVGFVGSLCVHWHTLELVMPSSLPVVVPRYVVSHALNVSRHLRTILFTYFVSLPP